jgi:hypothetical protein
MPEPVSPADTFFLELDRHPEYISSMAALYELDGQPAEERVLQSIEAFAAGAPRLRCVARRDEDGTWQWHERSGWSPRDVLRMTSADDDSPGAALRALAEAYQRPWDHAQTLWDCTIVRGSQRDHVLLRINHALGDGIYFFNADRRPSHSRRSAPTTPTTPTTQVPPGPGRVPARTEALNYARYLARILRGNHRRVGRATADRALGTIRVPLDDWKEEAARRNGRLNSLFMGIVGAILTSYFADVHHRHLPHVNVVMPIDIRSGDRREGNIASKGQVLLPPSATVPEDLRAIEVIVQQARQPENLTVGPRAARILGRLPAVVGQPLTYRTMLLADTVGSNLRNPLPPVSFGGCSVESLFPVAPATGNPVSFCLGTYADHVHVTMTVDTGLAPEPAQLFAITEKLLSDLWPECVVQHPWSGASLI